MGERARNAIQLTVDAGLPGLVLVVAGCIGVTLLTAKNIDGDEGVVSVAVACLGAMVAAYRVREVNRKNKGDCDG